MSIIEKKGELSKLSDDEVGKKLKSFKLQSEANLVTFFYINPTLVKEANLKISDFTFETWKVYYAIIKGMVNENIVTADEYTIAVYLDKHPKLKAFYEKHNGFELIKRSKEFLNEDTSNYSACYREFKKYESLLKLYNKGFAVCDNLSKFVDMTAEEIYEYYDIYLNDAFINIDTEVKTYAANEGLEELIEEMDSGLSLGKPLDGAEILTRTIGGFNTDGNIYGFGANSGVGKSTVSLIWLLPTIIKNNEKIIVIINEEDEKKVKKELLVWVVNNIFGGYVDENGEKKLLNKIELRDGGFSKELKKTLYDAAKYIGDKTNTKTITIIPLERYTCSGVIKIIKKYADLGVKSFILDTFKEGADIETNQQTWKQMERDMRSYYDVIKSKAKNVGLWVTYQMSKASGKTRHLTNFDIGQGKSIVDVMSCNILMRDAFADEYEGESKAIKYYRIEGKSKIECRLDKNKKYVIIFIGKNRFGDKNYQIIAELDLGTDKYKDVGIAYIPEDF